MKRSLIATTLLSLFAVSSVNAAQETTSETAELRKIIAEQDKILKDLERRLDETDQRVEATADAVDSASTSSNATTIGGYGELHYNNISDNNDSADDKKEIDFHRFVLFFGKEFNSTTRFFSEFELEHALSGDGDDKPGEVELEQAYIEHDINEQFTTQMGVFLVPVGLMNETHEPPTFYGVERNSVEKNILPTTWWEAGANLNYKPAAGWSIDTAVHSGLFVNDSYLPRKGRQKVAEAEAEAMAFTGRVSYTAIPGLQLAASMQYQEDITQGGVTKDGTVVDEASATLLTAHAVYQINQFTFKALYATWDIDGDEAAALGRDEQTGYYFEPSYRFNDEVGVFVRYSAWDNNAGNDLDTETEKVSFGVNYYLHENVVLKADYEIASGDTATKDSLASEDVDMDGFNLGIGYQF